MADDLTAGAPVLHPGRVAGVGSLHLGRTEARRKAAPALLGVCNAALGVPLMRAPRPRWWRRRRWCPECRAYADYLRTFGET